MMEVEVATVLCCPQYCATYSAKNGIDKVGGRVGKERPTVTVRRGIWTLIWTPFNSSSGPAVDYLEVQAALPSTVEQLQV